MKSINLKFLLFINLSLSIFGIGCSTNSVPNNLTQTEIDQGWKLLFDGQSLSHWHLYNNPNFPGAWYVENGEIRVNPNEERGRADLTSNEEYENYELYFEWKLAKEGNSGVFINVYEHDSLATAWQTGPEYQLLEDSHADIDKPLKMAGCLYGFTPQKNYVKTKKSGEWNQSKIIQNEGNVQFYLNGVLTAEMDFNTPKWKDAIRKSSFKDKPEFGVRTKGKIALQDWANGVAFRNLKIKEI